MLGKFWHFSRWFFFFPLKSKFEDEEVRETKVVMFVEIFFLIISLFYFLNWKSIKRTEAEKCLKFYFPGEITWKVFREKYPQNLKTLVFLFLFTCTGFFKVSSFLCSRSLLFLDKRKKKKNLWKIKRTNPKIFFL